jgi:hypothetical protein
MKIGQKIKAKKRIARPVKLEGEIVAITPRFDRTDYTLKNVKILENITIAIK